MGSEKPSFLAQPVVKSIFVFRNGDPYYEARRIVINQKRVSNFETLLREVTGGVQAPFGAVRNIYTPRGGHKVDSLESLRSGEQYVAAGRERFKKLDYHQITSRKKKMLLPMQAKPLMQNRIIVSARFLKPIKEPCTIFVVANGDVLNPAMRILIHQRMLGHFERILEMITEKMGLRVLGGVRSLYTYEGHQVTDRNQLEKGQLYVAVGRERFKKLPYSDLLFTRPRGRRRVSGVKAYFLPPLYKFSKQNGNTSPSKSKSTTQCSDSGDGDSKASPPGHDDDNKREQLSSIVRQISQARLISLRKRRSGQSEILGSSDHGDADDLETKTDDTNTENKTLNNYTDDEHPADANNDAKATQEPQEESVEATAENTTEEDTMIDKEETQDMNGEKEEGGEKEKSYDQNDEREGRATVESEEKEVKEEMKEEVTDAGEGAVKSEEQGISHSNIDEIQDSEAREEGSNSSSEGEKDEPDTSMGKEKPDEDAGSEENGSNDQNNDVDTGEEQKDTETSNDPENTETDN
ncbi:doublecortin domain-containing protein 2-like [Betta splendens]|uniref:Doublecortin domain-containing protein 2 n=1 Tax=Betta splendens TaxID=158456 RepID=A0A6P7KRB7_BETSP|nr:doublecortin domain-containing protein 2-like [Betta splendens]